MSYSSDSPPTCEVCGSYYHYKVYQENLTHGSYMYIDFLCNYCYHHDHGIEYIFCSVDNYAGTPPDHPGCDGNNCDYC